MEERREYKKTLSSTKLRANYFQWLLSCDMFETSDALKTFFSGYQAHHIIPRAIIYAAFEAGYLTTQKEIDIFDSGWNCIMLSTSKESKLFHRGSHPGYSTMVLEQILNHDNETTMSFLERCHNYVYAMNQQMLELINADASSKPVAVRDLKKALDDMYETLSKGNLIENGEE